MIQIEDFAENGRKPFRDWLDSLDSPNRAVVTEHLVKLMGGNTSQLKSLSGGLLEYRIRRKPELRLYFGRKEQNHLVALLGGKKKNQSRDILRARTYWSRYHNQRDDGII